jgi:hypothetical protein
MPSADSPASEVTKTSSKPFSISLSSKAKPSIASNSQKNVNGKKRPYSALVDPQEDDEDDRSQRVEVVTAFDRAAGGAIGSHSVVQTKAPLVIQGQKNKNWREDGRRKRGKNLLPEEEQAARQGKIIKPNDNDNEEQKETYGLTVVKKRTLDVDQLMPDAGPASAVENKPMTADEEALAALLEEKRQSNLVLPAIGTSGDDDTRFSGRGNDENDFWTDIAARPDSATLDDYAAVPIEEFGAALLRGMGWKEGDAVGKRRGQVIMPKILERRPALLGIGAKQIPDGIEELGAWGKGAKKKPMYTKGLAPVLLKNSVTGETLTEEELKAKQEKQKKDEEDWKERRDRNLRIDGDRKAEKGRGEESRSHHSSRQSSSRRDHDRSSNSSRSRDERDKEHHRRHRREHRNSDRSESSRSRHRERDRDDDLRSRKRAEVY